MWCKWSIGSTQVIKCDATPPQLLIVLTISWKKHHKKKNSPKKNQTSPDLAAMTTKLAHGVSIEAPTAPYSAT